MLEKKGLCSQWQRWKDDVWRIFVGSLSQNPAVRSLLAYESATVMSQTQSEGSTRREALSHIEQYVSMWLCLHSGALYLLPDFIITYSEFNTTQIESYWPAEKWSPRHVNSCSVVWTLTSWEGALTASPYIKEQLHWFSTCFLVLVWVSHEWY